MPIHRRVMQAMRRRFSAGYERAVAWFRRAIEASRNCLVAYLNLGAARAQVGRLDEARSAAKAGLAVNPTFTVSRTQRLDGHERRHHLSSPG